MKTTNLLKRTLITTAIILSLFTVKAQHTNARRLGTIYNIGVETSVACDGHGAFYVPYFGILKKYDSFNFGATVQKRSGIMNGFKLSYIRNLSATYFDPEDCDLLQINFFSSIQYTAKLPLCYNQAMYEKKISHDDSRNWNNVMLATAELTAGFQFQVNITNAVSWKTYAGASVYHHCSPVTEPMGLERTDLVLNVGTGINFIIR